MPNYISKFTGSEIDRRLTDVDSKISATEKGAKNGVASLDESGKVPSTQLPSYVDDVLEFNSRDNFPQSGESGKLYLALDSNKIYRWSGSRYIEIVGGESADKFIDIEVDCDHKYEITGMTGHTFNLQIPNKAQVVFKKVQGQSRSRSLNVLKLNSINETTNSGLTYSVDAKGIVSVQGANLNRYFGINLVSNAPFINNETYTIQCLNLPSGFIVRVGDLNVSAVSKNNPLKTFTFSGDKQFIRIQSETANNTFSKTTLKIMIVKGTFDNNTMPSFEPFDNYLENSKNHFISTGRNLFASESFDDANLGYDASTCEIKMKKTDYVEHTTTSTELPKGNYTLMRSTTDQINSSLIDTSGVTYTMPYHTNRLVITLKEDTRFNKISVNGAVKVNFKFVIVAGDVAYDTKYFEPYNKTITNFGMELGEYDYIQNGKIVRQTSERKLIDGSESWGIVSSASETNNNLFNITLDSVGATEFSGASNYFGKFENVRATTSNDGFYVYGNALYVRKKGMTLEQFKQWLGTHPITLVYKLTSPTTSKVDVPNGYGVSYGGLEEQSGKVPYIITKNYPISLSSQLKNNVFIDNAQQSEIESNARRIFTTKYASNSEIRDLFRHGHGQDANAGGSSEGEPQA